MHNSGRKVGAAIIHCRLATTNDVETIKQILNSGLATKISKSDNSWGDASFTDEEILDLLGWGTVYVAEIGNQVVATATLTDYDDYAWAELNGRDGLAVYIHKLAVLSDYKSKGIGKSFIAYLEGVAKNDGRCFVRLDCPIANMSLCRYYETVGFKKVGDKANFSGVDSEFNNTSGYSAALYEKQV